MHPALVYPRPLCLIAHPQRCHTLSLLYLSLHFNLGFFGPCTLISLKTTKPTTAHRSLFFHPPSYSVQDASPVPSYPMTQVH
ncbi:hypothetical protein OF83DRAFT_820890 [Amylostereum chailletii]|nr:hypothetical protein OF83DRAFT_820890 [Amylostereum chailletii]